MRQYLDNLYKQWKANPNNLFGNLPKDPNGVNGYCTQCAPIPYFGAPEAQFAFGSIEPHKTRNFGAQC